MSLKSTLLAACAALAMTGPAIAAPLVVHPETWPAAKSPRLVDAATEAKITALIGAMSLEEKVGQTIQADISAIKPEDLKTYPLGSILAGGNSAPDGNDRATPQAWLDLARAYRAVSLEARPGHTPIPLMFGVDAVHGHNNVVGATLFPHNIGLGAAHDPDLIRRIGEATAQEVAVAGADWSFGPTLAAPRDDRWGRAYEGYSEDPEIIRAYAGQMVLGLQGKVGGSDLLQRGHVAASAKHFLGDGGTAGGKDQGDTVGEEADLIRLHAQGYPPAIDAGILTVMASFSSWKGQKLHGEKGLLTDVLKGRMGFDGFVVGDWNGHGQVAGCSNESCAASINAGLDMFMAPDSWKALYKNTLAQARSGEIPAARLDDAVRRILRVKFALGLFDPARPLEGKFDRLGAPEHRAIAREAVRKSLVLLKNDGVLPIRAGARILVAGDGADDIGKQSGGWTLTWQGTGNKNADFPNGQSIYGGIAEAAAAAGGKAALSVDGAFTEKPDVAVVVFGENPYAEFQGDRANLDYQGGDRSDLALIAKLKAAGVPVVAVFLSGRPMWVNPEINASDAFVAAWLPGSEGGGIADVLVGDKAGKPRHDFTGKLSFSWPKTAKGEPLNRGDANHDPQFAYGYGLSYARPGKVAALSEESGVAASAGAGDVLFAAGRIVAPWRLTLNAEGAMVEGDQTTLEVAGVLTARPVDAEGVQERGRAFTWTGAKPAALTLLGPPQDFLRQSNGDMAVGIRLRTVQAPTSSVKIVAGCGDGCSVALDARDLVAGPGSDWRTIKVKLSCFAGAGADMQRFSGVSLATNGKLALEIADIRLASNEGDAVCPAAAKP